MKIHKFTVLVARPDNDVIDLGTLRMHVIEAIDDCMENTSMLQHPVAVSSAFHDGEQTINYVDPQVNNLELVNEWHEKAYLEMTRIHGELRKP